MRYYRWFIVFIIALVISGMALCGFNYAVDPFGVFGDRFMKWYAYDMVNNPRMAKIAYLDQYHDKYDSYIIGGSKSSSISPAQLNKYYKGASFYNMMMYGGDFYDYEKILYYIVDHYKVKNIVIHMSMHEIGHYKQQKPEINTHLSAKVTGDSLIKFYAKFLTLNLKYSFMKLEGVLRARVDPMQYNEIMPFDGTYNKSTRDAEVLGTLDEYLKKYPEFTKVLAKTPGTAVNQDIESLRRMKKYCDDRGISFKFIAAPAYYREMDRYGETDMRRFWRGIAEITDFWDFTGYNTISNDARNFYDPMHYRNSIGTIMLARIFGNKAVTVPANFGRYVTKENVDKLLDEMTFKY